MAEMGVRVLYVPLATFYLAENLNGVGNIFYKIFLNKRSIELGSERRRGTYAPGGGINFQEKKGAHVCQIPV